MNRRDFTRSLAALGLAPALPALPAAAAPAGPAYMPYMYGLGVHMARSTGLSSAEMLSRHLALPPAAARAMQAQLMRSGIITAPNTAGVAVAAEPYMTSIRFKLAQASSAKPTRRLLRHLTDAAQAETRPSDSAD